MRARAVAALLVAVVSEGEGGGGLLVTAVSEGEGKGGAVSGGGELGRGQGRRWRCWRQCQGRGWQRGGLRGGCGGVEA